MTANQNRLLKFSLGLAIGAACLWIALRNADPDEILHAFTESDWRLAGPLLALYLLHFPVRAVRWRVLLAPLCTTNPAALVSPIVLGFFANNILPARLGELLRMHLGARILNLRNSQVLATLVLERVFDLIATVSLLWLAQLATRDTPEEIVNVANYAALAGGTILASLAIFVVWPGPVMRLVILPAALLPAAWQGFLERQLQFLAEGLQAIKSPGLIMQVLVYSIAVWILTGSSIYIGLVATDIDIPYSASFVVLAATVLAIALPGAPGYFGAIQLAYTVALAPYDVDASHAVAASLYFHLLTYLAVVLAGLFFLNRLGLQVKSLSEEALNK